MGEIEVKINGKETKIESGLNVAQLTEKMGLKGFFAVEINLNIINKEDYAKTALNPGDEVEIVSFTGGG